VRFLVPSADDLGASAPAGGDADVAPAELSNSSVAGSSKVRSQPAAKEPQIEFLCPNGHHLHGPASLQGRPGACPECGSRFRIPLMDEGRKEGETDQLAPDAQLGRDGGDGAAADVNDAGPAGDAPQIAEPPVRADDESASDSRRARAADRKFVSNTQIVLREPGSSVAGSAKLSAGITPPHPLAEVVARLWASKGETAKLHLKLTGGETLTPDHFARRLSRGSHAVFASKTAEGSWTVTAVRWDAVEQVVLGELKALPAELAN
jgi:hypothetical protein